VVEGVRTRSRAKRRAVGAGEECRGGGRASSSRQKLSSHGGPRHDQSWGSGKAREAGSGRDSSLHQQENNTQRSTSKGDVKDEEVVGRRTTPAPSSQGEREIADSEAVGGLRL
jgi:hypothetical protein